MLKTDLYQDGTRTTISVKFSTVGLKIFFNARHIYLSISAKERCWFEFLCEDVGRHGIVYIGKEQEEAFVQHASQISGGSIKINVKTMNNFTRKLVGKGLLLKTNDSGVFYINPKYVQLTTAQKREEDLKFLFHQAEIGNIDVRKLIDRPLEEILEPVKTT